MRVIAVCNQRGGVGKTTTAWAILTGATIRGKKALAIDFDPQGSLTYITGADASRPQIQTTKAGDVMPATLDLAALKDASILERAILPLSGRYDVVVIDCPPSLGTAQIAALRAANEVIIPIQPEELSLQGLFLIRDEITQINPDIKILGAFFARYRGRTALARDLSAAIKTKCGELGIPFIDTPVREGIALQEAQFAREAVFTYKPKSNPARDYMALLDAINI